MSQYSERPGADEYAPFYEPYIARVPDGDIVAILERQGDETRALLDGLDETAAGYAYAPGKWTLREVVGHLTDADRLFCGRALRFARGDTTPLPGWDEKHYAPAGRFNERTLSDLLDDFAAARASTTALFRGLPGDAWTRSGDANGKSVSVRALAWIAAGHELHHRSILAERYLPGV